MFRQGGPLNAFKSLSPYRSGGSARIQLNSLAAGGAPERPWVDKRRKEERSERQDGYRHGQGRHTHPAMLVQMIAPTLETAQTRTLVCRSSTSPIA